MNIPDKYTYNSKKKIIEEYKDPEKDWFEWAKNIKSVDQLTVFVKHMLYDFDHDYGTLCHAIAACAVASAYLGAEVKGITGFQSGFVMWDFIKNWTKQDNKCGLRLIDYDNFLYPQYEHKYDKTIDISVWKSIQEEAKKNLEERDACDEVKEHWKSIVEGVVPFGYSVKYE